MNLEQTRRNLAEIDQLRKWAREAESARNSIRCFLPVRVRWRDRALGFINTLSRGEFHAMPPEVTSAVYEALAVVRDKYESDAAEIEKRMGVEDE